MQKAIAFLSGRDNPAAIQYAFIACAGLAIFAHVVFLAPALYFLSRADLGVDSRLIEAWLHRNAQRIVWAPALLVAVMFIGMLPAPQDDLLAISSIANGSFSHASFAFSNWGLQPVSPWYGFEKLLSFASQLMGQDMAMRLAQSTAVALTAVSVTLAIRNQMRERPDLVLLAVLLIGLAFASMTIGRAISGRVEAFFFAWAIAALWMPASIWLIVGIALSPMYWLAWIYAPAALLLKAPLRLRLIVGTLYAAAAGGIWLWISGGQYTDMLALTSTWIAARESAIMENLPLLQGIGVSPAALILLIVAAMLAIAGKGHREEWPIALVAAWFTLPDMLRYLPILATLAAVWIMQVSARGERPSLSTAMLLAMLAPLAVAFANGLPSGKLENLPKFFIPPHAVVLGPLESGLYATIRHNPGIKATPSFELGATDAVIQKTAKKLQAGQFDCDVLRAYPIDYVLENRLKDIPSCLKLDQVQGTWRLWKTGTHPMEVSPQ